ncbi:MAG: VOC family protein [Hyphomicrobiaceae bacterium]
MSRLPGRVNLITLGVADVARSSDFYCSIGFVRVDFDSDGVVFFQLDGTVLAVFGRDALAEDAGVASFAGGPGPVSLAINFAHEANVDAALALAHACGATIVQPARRVFWGGYSGYFSDPDGHLWEMAYNPHFPLDSRGHFALPTLPAHSTASVGPQ